MFLFIDAVAFVAWNVISLGLHAVLLPVSFAISSQTGLRTALIWFAYYTLEAILSAVVPYAVPTKILTLVSPFVAIYPMLQVAGLAADVLPLRLLSSPWIIKTFGTLIQASPLVFAVAEPLCTVVVIKALGSTFKDRETLSEGNKRLIAMTVLAIWAYATYQLVLIYFDEGTEPSHRLLIIGVAGLALLITLSIPFIASPGRDDVPLIEGLFLYFYAALCIVLASRPMLTNATYKRFISMASSSLPILNPTTSLLAFFDLDRAYRILAYFFDLVTSFLHMSPWLALVSISYRPLIIGSVVSIWSWHREAEHSYKQLYNNLDDAASSTSISTAIKLVGLVLSLGVRPFLILYYAKLLLNALEGSFTVGDEQTYWVSAFIAIGVYFLMLVIRRA